MATKKDDHEKRIHELEFTMDKIVLPWKEKTEKYLEKSRGGIDFATLFDNKLTTAIILAVIAAIFWYVGVKG